MEHKSLTIQDVAREAGVSVATVSRVLNNSPLVKKNTTLKVEKAIEKLGYQPNYLGRDLRRAETKRILFFTPNIGTPITGDLVKGMDDAAKEHGYYLLVCPTDNKKEREEELMQLVKNKIVDGLIVISSTLDSDELDDLGEKYPIVQVGEWIETKHICSVSVDDEQAALDAVQHLIELGHKRIAMINSHVPKMISSSKISREKGYYKALQAAHLPLDTDLLKYGGETYEESFEITKALLELEDPPTAIFCYSDVLAIGCINAIQSVGLKVPEDVSVIGFDDTKESIMATPKITTIHQPKYDLGYKTMELLIQNIHKGENISQHITIPHQLIVRESSGSAAGTSEDQ